MLQVGVLWRTTVGFLSITLPTALPDGAGWAAPRGSRNECAAARDARSRKKLEFWRAAPEDALDLGAKEFGDQRGQGAPGLDADDELGVGAAGHVLAAGLRLYAASDRGTG